MGGWLRPDGTPKGMGFFGNVGTPHGYDYTERSIGVLIDGKEVDIPLMVPTLTQEELELIIREGKPTVEMVRKAIDYARKRMKSGKSQYAQPNEKMNLNEYPEEQTQYRNIEEITPVPYDFIEILRKGYK